MRSIATCSVPTATSAPNGATNAYLVGREGAMLVDPAGRTPGLDRAVEARSVEHVLLTHTHPDHVGGVAEYATRTGATVWAHGAYEDRFEWATGIGPDRTLSDGEVIRTGDGTRVEVLETPGHAPDHLVFAIGSSLLVGDLSMAEGSVLVGDDGDLAAYLASLDRLLALSPSTCYPGHGPTIEDPDETLSRLIEHRRERERRVVAAVRNGRETVEGIVESAYERDLTGVEHLAGQAVRAHLRKLAAEGVVRWDGERAHALASDD
ncbi:MBL fold metallo-hydrolase [Natronorarus salvus]|uniref:MBL fold metallo-hydrolase n=1 Tax=Natronorarus salvus TaxID=3117733 RepID=UPI002F26CBD4